MSIARIFPCMPLLIAAAVGAFMPAAHAQASSVLRPGESAGTSSPAIRVAELVRKKHGKEAIQQKHAKEATRQKHAKATTQQKHAKETTRQKHAKESTRQKHAKDRAKALKAYAAQRKKQRPGELTHEPDSNSILFRLAPYDYSLG
jgi:hypothetical protein